MQPLFDTMNETDVREIIVRPLLARLGYAHGTQANIRTEVSLRYDRAFLGRKNPKKDPPLAGRADYICDATSYGRWVVEVKAPEFVITQDDVEQAHTYAAHPQVNALYFLITNGREFRLYGRGQLEEPLLAWSYSDTERHMMTLFNILGYEAIKKVTEAIRPDKNKPLGPGLGSELIIVGGQIKYGEHESDHPLLQTDVMNGLTGGVTGVGVSRDADGRLHAVVRVISPYQQLQELNRLAGIEDFHFFCSAEYVSADAERPTIFQNVIEARIEPGIRARLVPGMPEIVLPFGFDSTVYTEATGYVEGGHFKGVITFEYNYQLIRGGPTGNAAMDAMIRNMPMTARIVGSGEAEIRFK